jgi:hypothetical protein
VTSCLLERLKAEHDKLTSDGTSAACRVLISYEGFDIRPPGLFLFDEDPTSEDVGPFTRVKPWRSSLDVWFENQNAANRAFDVANGAISSSKARRGIRVRNYLAKCEGNARVLLKEW